MPVIDINKLPRYGMLAPPLERPPKQAGKFIDYDRATNVFVKNRGALREALEGQTGGHQDSTWLCSCCRPPHAGACVCGTREGDESCLHGASSAASEGSPHACLQGSWRRRRCACGPSLLPSRRSASCPSRPTPTGGCCPTPRVSRKSVSAPNPCHCRHLVLIHDLGADSVL